MKWQELAASSHYQTALAVEQALDKGKIPQAKAGIEELVDALSRAEKRALKSHLINLMVHIIKWNAQPAQRTRSWRATINNARREIADIQEETPSLNRRAVQTLWDRCFESAKEETEGEMNLASSITKLSWKEVFEKDYGFSEANDRPKA